MNKEKEISPDEALRLFKKAIVAYVNRYHNGNYEEFVVCLKVEEMNLEESK